MNKAKMVLAAAVLVAVYAAFGWVLPWRVPTHGRPYLLSVLLIHGYSVAIGIGMIVVRWAVVTVTGGKR